MWLAARASVAIPGVLPPVIDGGDILVDGGILNNLPIDVMSQMRRGPIVAVDVSREWTLKATIDNLDHQPLRKLFFHARNGTPNIFSILMAAVGMTSHAQVKELRKQVDILFEPPLGPINMLDWKSFHRVIDTGYRHAMEILEKRKGALLPTAATMPAPRQLA
jgi:NTE family protein